MLYKFAIQIFIQMKLTSLLFSLLVTTTFLNAQEAIVIGGLNFSNQSAKDNDNNYAKEDEYRTRLSMHFGILMDLALTDNFSIESGLLYNPKGYKIMVKDDGYKATLKSKLQYLEVPILAKYKFDLNDDVSLYGVVGPALAYAIAGGFSFVEKEDGEKFKDNGKLKFGTTSASDYKRLDLGLMIGAGINLKKIRAGIFYDQGLLNVAPHSINGYKIKNRMFGVSVGYILKSN